MSRRVRCRMCGELTSRPRTVYAVAAGPDGMPVPGARQQKWQACESCASLLDDGDDDGEEEDDDAW